MVEFKLFTKSTSKTQSPMTYSFVGCGILWRFRRKSRTDRQKGVLPLYSFTKKQKLLIYIDTTIVQSLLAKNERTENKKSHRPHFS